MKRLRVLVMGVLSGLLLAGCAQTGDGKSVFVPYDRTVAGDARTIGIITPLTGPQPVAHVAASLGSNFGLIGALIDAGVEANRVNNLEEILVAQGFDIQASVTEALVAALEKKGYAAKMVATERSAETRSFLSSYPDPADTGVDAYLDVVVIDYGFLAAGSAETAPFRPYVSLACRLVQAGRPDILMNDRIIYNPLNPYGVDINISPDPAYAYPTFDTLSDNQAEAVAGLRAAISTTADHIGHLLR